jgi:hypothetical protein
MTPERPAYEVTSTPAVVRDGIRAGLTPDQIYARNGKRRAIYLAAIVRGARVAGEFATFEPTAANVQMLRDKHGHRWERIAVRVFGDRGGRDRRGTSTTRRRATRGRPRSRTRAAAAGSRR